MLQHRPDVARLLAAQSGVVSTRQLLTLGYSRGQVARMARRWHSPAQGIHLAGEVTWLTAVWAGLLAGGDDAAVGGLAAGHLLGFVATQPKHIEVWARHRRKDFRVGALLVTFRQGVRASRGEPRRSNVEDTVLDIAATGSELDAVAACTRSLADRYTTATRLLEALRARSRQRHRGVLESLCSQTMHGVESALEWLFETRVLQPHSLPAPQRQEARTAGRVDGAYEAWRCIVELDGARYHRDKGHDYHRDNEHVITREERTLRFGWDQVVRGSCRSARQVALALELGGWPGKLSRCPACPN